MKTIHIGRLQRAAANREPGYVEAHMKVGKQVQFFGQPFVQINDADYAAIGKQFNPSWGKTQQTPGPTPGASPPKIAPPVGMTPRARNLPFPGASIPKPGLGLGDVIHKVAGPIGRAINWPCMKGDNTTDLKPGSPCDKLRQAANKIQLPQ